MFQIICGGFFSWLAMKHLDAFPRDEEKKYAKISKIWAIDYVCQIPE